MINGFLYHQAILQIVKKSVRPVIFSNTTQGTPSASWD